MRTPLLDVIRPSVHALSRAYFGLELRGVANIPATGAVIITPNHQTYADPPLVTIPIRRPVYYMAWSRLFHIPMFGWFIRRLRAFPVDLGGSDPRATRAVVRLLAQGAAVMIFPEGERSRDGGVARFKLGAFRLASALGVPVLPVSIAGGHESWPPGRFLPRPGRITITYHAPEHANPDLGTRESAQDLADRTLNAILTALPETTRVR